MRTRTLFALLIVAAVTLVWALPVSAVDPETPTGLTPVTDFGRPAEWPYECVDPNDPYEQCLESAEQYVTDNYPGAAWVIPDPPGFPNGHAATARYNCHAYAWHLTVMEKNAPPYADPIWIGWYSSNGEDPYITPGNGYKKVDSAAEATKVHWPGSSDHSGDAREGTTMIYSKWGVCPLLYHDVSYQPYGTNWEWYAIDDDPGADIYGFGVVNGVARWELDALYRTETLYIEGRNTVDDEWTRLEINVPVKFGHNEVSVAGSGYRYFRLVEQETTGKIIKKGYSGALTVPPSEIVTHPIKRPVRTLEEARRNFERVKARYIASGVRKVPGPQRAGATVADMIIYTNSTMMSAVQAGIADFWNLHGYTVVVKNVNMFPTDPDAFRNALKADIINESSNTMFFLLAGDGADYVQFDQVWPTPEWEAIRQHRINSTGYPPQGEPAKDIIPTWYTWDPLNRNEGNMSYFNPYWFTDQPYGDLNGDDIPDRVVARLPFLTATHVYDYASKIWATNSSWRAGKAAFFIGDVDIYGGDDTRAVDVANKVKAAMPSWVDQVEMYRSAAVNPGDENTMPAALINAEQPELLVEVSSISARYRPGYFFNLSPAVNPWDMSMITTTQPMVMLSASCASADFSRVDSPNYENCVSHMFLTEPNKGTAAWIGPGAGTWQSGNEEVAVAMVDELYETPSRAIGLSFLSAIQRVLNQYSDTETIVNTAKSYILLGDPLLPFMFDAPPPPPPPGGGGCPTVFVNNGDDYVLENTILGLVDERVAGNSDANVTDTYVLQAEPAGDTGEYQIEIREFENEHTYLDQVELITVDHAQGTELTILEDGTYVIHEGYLTPVSASGVEGDLVGLLSERDNQVFEGRAGDEVTLRYRIPRGVNLSMALRIKHKIDLGDGGGNIVAQAGIEAMLHVPGTDEYVSLGTFTPREYLAPKARLISEALLDNGITSGEFEIKLVWHTDHGLDFAGLMTPVNLNPKTTTMPLEYVSHSKTLVSRHELTEADGRFVELEPGETLSLRFAASTPADEERSFVLRASGHYTSGSQGPDAPDLPEKLMLYANRPNPFNPTTTIRFDLPSQSHVTLRVYSVNGSLVTTLTNGMYPGGRHDVVWDGRDRNGQSVSTGVYFYTLETSLGVQTRKMTLLK